MPMTSDEAYDCGVRSKSMDTDAALRAFYSSCGFDSVTITTPEGYAYFCPSDDPPSALMDMFWEGYHNG